MTPIEILGAALIIMVLGSTISANTDEEEKTDVWYCFVCAGTTSESHMNHGHDGPNNEENETGENDE